MKQNGFLMVRVFACTVMYVVHYSVSPYCFYKVKHLFVLHNPEHCIYYFSGFIDNYCFSTLIFWSEYCQVIRTKLWNIRLISVFLNGSSLLFIILNKWKFSLDTKKKTNKYFIEVADRSIQSKSIQWQVNTVRTVNTITYVNLFRNK